MKSSAEYSILKNKQDISGEMEDNKRIYQFMGLAARAGKLVSGFEAVKESLRRGQVELLVVAEDISRNTMSGLLDCLSHCPDGPDTFRFGESHELGYYIGKRPRAVVAVTDKGFAVRLRQMFDESLANSPENDKNQNNNKTEDKK